MAAEDPSLGHQPPPRLTMAAFWRDFSDEVLSLDRGLPWTFWQLLVRPGWLVRLYVDRRDPRVSRPVRYFLLGFVLLALMMGSRSPKGASDSLESIIRSGFGDAGGGAAVWTVLEHPVLLALVTIVPATASGLRLAYARHAPTFAEMWVFAVYVIAQVFVYWSLIGIGEVWLGERNAEAGAILPPIILVLPVACLMATCLEYFPEPGLGRVLRASLATLMALALTYGLVAAILVAAFQLGKHWPALFGA
jgi:hypothetical protein